MPAASNYYIDLGTANTLIYRNQHGVLLNEPSVVTTHQRRGQTSTYAVGTAAKQMLGKTPKDLVVHRPLRDGVIADFDSTARMVKGFIKRVKQNCFWYRPRLIISLPYRVTYHERQAVREIGFDLGARQVHLLHEPVAAAIGANLPVFEKRGSMIVDIGGGTTEIAIMAVGGIVTAQAVRIGGNHIDEAIIGLLRRNYQLAIGEQTAEKIKTTVATSCEHGEQFAITIGGLNCVTGLPTRFNVTSAMVFPAVNSVLKIIIAAIRDAFVHCPPDIAGDIERSGVVVTGGGALIHHLQERLQAELGLPVHIADNPLLSVARGGAWALERPDLFETLEAPI